jgi:hypothetical protein
MVASFQSNKQSKPPGFLSLLQSHAKTDQEKAKMIKRAECDE